MPDDRDVTDWTDAVAILKKCAAVCVAMKDGEKPYAVPLSFGYRGEDGSLSLYFQISSSGRTAELLRKNPEISFTAEHLLPPGRTDVPCPKLPEYESVVGEGRAAFMEEYGQKLKALGIFMSRYGYTGVLAYNPAAFSRSALVEVRVSRLSAQHCGPELICGY